MFMPSVVKAPEDKKLIIIIIIWNIAPLICIISCC